MAQKEETKEQKKKGFWGKLIDKLDKKMEEKAQKTSCCGGSDGKKGSPCC